MCEKCLKIILRSSVKCNLHVGVPRHSDGVKVSPACSIMTGHQRCFQIAQNRHEEVLDSHCTTEPLQTAGLMTAQPEQRAAAEAGRNPQVRLGSRDAGQKLGTATSILPRVEVTQLRETAGQGLAYCRWWWQWWILITGIPRLLSPHHEAMHLPGNPDLGNSWCKISGNLCHAVVHGWHDAANVLLAGKRSRVTRHRCFGFTRPASTDRFIGGSHGNHLHGSGA